MFDIDQWEDYSQNNSEFKKNCQIQQLITQVSDYNFYIAPIYLQIKQLLIRNIKIILRDQKSFRARLGTTLFTALLESVFWWNFKSLDSFNYDPSNPDNPGNSKALQNSQDRLGAILYSVLFQVFNSVLTSCLTVPMRRIVFQLERTSNWLSNIVNLFGLISIYD